MTTRRAQLAPLNLAFSALVYSLGAVALTAAWNLQIGASLRWHVFTEAYGLLVFAIAFRRFRLARPCVPIMEGPAKDGIGQFVMLAAIGGMLGLLALAGSVALFGICAFGINWAPWFRLAPGRNKLLASCAMVVGGGACVMLTARLPRDPFVLPLFAWALWAVVCYDLVYLLFRKATGAQTAGHKDASVAQREIVLQPSDAGWTR